MNNELKLNDISDELLIINKTTIERLFQEENKDGLVLYLFYYKTAKWQNHNPIKAADEYTKKCLHWGTDKLKRVKKQLKDMELIEVEKRLNESKRVTGWYVKVKYYYSRTPEATTPISPQVVPQETNTINNNILSTNNNKDTKEIYKERFETFYKEYPKKVSKQKTLQWFLKHKPDEELFNKMMSSLKKQKQTQNWLKDNGQYIPYPTTWLNGERWEDEVDVENNNEDRRVYF